MAEHVGMDRSFISDLENGKKEVCIRNLELLATTFGMTVSKLVACRREFVTPRRSEHSAQIGDTRHATARLCSWAWQLR